MELVLSDDAIDASTEFARVIEDYRSRWQWSELFDGDHRPLWRELIDGGWTTVSPDEVGPMFSLRLAEIWGWSLVPLPFMQTMLARRYAAGGDEEAMLTFPVADRLGVSRVPFGDLAGVEMLAGPTLAPTTPTFSRIERFAPSLPLAIVGGVDEGRLSGDLMRDIRAHAAAEALGAAVHAFDDAVAYAKIRVAYGKVIGQFQAVQHMLADMYRNIELARSAYTWAAMPEEEAMAARAARLSLRYSRKTVELAIQVHGGIGYTWELGLHYYLRHVIGLQTMTGLV